MRALILILTLFTILSPSTVISGEVTNKSAVKSFTIAGVTYSTKNKNIRRLTMSSTGLNSTSFKVVSGTVRANYSPSGKYAVLLGMKSTSTIAGASAGKLGYGDSFVSEAAAPAGAVYCNDASAAINSWSSAGNALPPSEMSCGLIIQNGKFPFVTLGAGADVLQELWVGECPLTGPCEFIN